KRVLHCGLHAAANGGAGGESALPSPGAELLPPGATAGANAAQQLHSYQQACPVPSTCGLGCWSRAGHFPDRRAGGLLGWRAVPRGRLGLAGGARHQ
ncbi:unnamed protein product, partial [Effrenium voratum]